MSGTAPYYQQLAGHPSAAHRINDSSLPLPIHDPNPLLTGALHDLWLVLQPLLARDPQIGQRFFYGGPGLPSLPELFQAIHTGLVSRCSLSAHYDIFSNFFSF